MNRLSGQPPNDPLWHKCHDKRRSTGFPVHPLGAAVSKSLLASSVPGPGDFADKPYFPASVHLPTCPAKSRCPNGERACTRAKGKRDTTHRFVLSSARTLR